MYKLRFATLAFLLMVFSGFMSPVSSELQLEFDGEQLEGVLPELILDFGQRKQGSMVAGQLIIRNVSQQPLQLSNVRGSCGLSVPAWPRQPIEPGQQAIIQVRYDSQRLGEIDRYITLHANTHSGRTLVKVKGEIVP